MPPRKWRPVGADDVVVMDTVQPFVGGQSPCITLNASTPHGIRQSGFSLVNNKRYTGRIYLRGTPGSKVNVTLIWGSGAQTTSRPLAFGALTERVQKISRFTFTVQGRYERWCNRDHRNRERQLPYRNSFSDAV